jgi:hypothetical protein
MKPFLYGSHHETEPVQIQTTQDSVCCEKEQCQPHVDFSTMSFHALLSQVDFGGTIYGPTAPHVTIEIDRLVPTPEDATAEEASDQE